MKDKFYNMVRFGKLHDIRIQIALPIPFLIIIIMFSLGIYISNFLHQALYAAEKEDLVSKVNLISEIISPYLIEEAFHDQLDYYTSLYAQRLETRLTIIDASGKVLGDSQVDKESINNIIEQPEIIAAKNSGIGEDIRYSDLLGYKSIYVAVPIIHKKEIISFVRLSSPVTSIDHQIKVFQQSLVLLTVVITIISILIILWITNKSMAPLQNITRLTGMISSGKIEPERITSLTDKSSDDEFGQLKNAFHHMAVQLNHQIRALETERSTLVAIFTVMTDGVLIIDERGRIQLINPAAESMFSITQSDTIGNSLIETLRNHQIQELWERCHRSGEAQYSTLEILPRRLYLRGVATPLGQALPGSTLLLFQNLTHMRRLETVRKDFISNISHELRTPLASLKALTETLQEGALDDPPAAKRFLQRMETEVDSLSLMVSELLELSRIESGRVPLRMKRTNPFILITNAIERLILQAERAGLELEIDCTENLPEITADPVRLEQVLVNLIHNAIKFTPQGGVIRVSARLMESNVQFCVEDNGVGISREDLPRIFERFYKTDRARSSGGTGLGLAIARHTVEMHGGKIWAKSIEGKGSQFYFIIPLAD